MEDARVEEDAAVRADILAVAERLELQRIAAAGTDGAAIGLQAGEGAHQCQFTTRVFAAMSCTQVRSLVRKADR